MKMPTHTKHFPKHASAIRNSGILALLILLGTTDLSDASRTTFNFATGQNGRGTDANWIVTAWQQSGTDYMLPRHARIVTPHGKDSADWGFGGWIKKFSKYTSMWIAPDPECGGCNGDFTVTYTFDLTGYNLSTASFSKLHFTLDDQGYVTLNGNVVATQTGGLWATMNAFSIPVADLVQGVNTLTITSEYADYDVEGVRMEGSLTVSTTAQVR